MHAYCRKNILLLFFLLKKQGGRAEGKVVSLSLRACGDQGQRYDAGRAGRAHRPDTDPYPNPSVQLPSHGCGSRIGAVHGWMDHHHGLKEQPNERSMRARQEVNNRATHVLNRSRADAGDEDTRTRSVRPGSEMGSG